MRTEPMEYGRLSWPEVRDAVRDERVPIVPVGTLEDHGPHLPIDTDVTLVEAICRGARRDPWRDAARLGESAAELIGKDLASRKR